MSFLGHDTIITGSMAAGSIRYWAAAVAAGKLLIDPFETHLRLRHSHHRYSVLGPNGVQELSVAIAGESRNNATAMRDVLINEHGNWRRLHWGALYSAYGQTPYFDYVADDLSRVINGMQTHLLEYNRQMCEVIIDVMDLPVEVEYAAEPIGIVAGATDLRGIIGAKRGDNLPIDNVPYYQQWSQRYGFVPDLSILDLIMNMGREGIYTLIKMVKKD